MSFGGHLPWDAWARYMKAPVEMGCGMGFLSKIYGEVNEEAYTKEVYPLIEAFVRENADFDQRNNVILLTEEDKVAPAAARS